MMKSTQLPKKRPLVRTTRQILDVVTAQRMPVSSVEVDLNRNVVAIRVAVDQPPKKDEEQGADEALATWEAKN
jgi:hypothetical protein